MANKDIKVLQNKILEIMIDIDNICRENEIVYYLMSGSALGAIRHKGFIPWDDDMDIFMTPDNYLKFKEIVKQKKYSNKYYLQELCKHENLITYAKVRANGTTFIEEVYKDLDMHHGIYVDIFILHNTSDCYLSQFKQSLCGKFLSLKKMAKYKRNRKLSVSKKVLALVLNALPKSIDVYALKSLYKYDNQETAYYCHFVGNAFFKKGIYEKDWFGNGKYVSFDNTYLKVPEKVEIYLKKRWGDYMQLPPVEKRQASQHAMYWNEKEGFEKYCSRIREYSDEKQLY